MRSHFSRLLWLAFFLATSLQTAAQDKVESGAESFVRRIYVHGVPYKPATQYGSEHIPKLVEMLADSREGPFWSNIVITLGFIGDRAAVEPIIDFIQRHEGVISRDAYVAKTSAIMSLGYLLNKTPNERALTYLIEGMDPETWVKRKLKWSSPFFNDDASRNIELSKNSIHGLALSGRPEAAKAIESASKQKLHLSATDTFVTEALNVNKDIAAKGLAGYYQD